MWFRIVGFGKSGSFGKGVFCRKVHLPQILKNLEIQEILENPQTGKQRRTRPFSRDSRESRDSRDSRDSSSKKTPSAMTFRNDPFSWSRDRAFLSPSPSSGERAWRVPFTLLVCLESGAEHCWSLFRSSTLKTSTPPMCQSSPPISDPHPLKFTKSCLAAQENAERRPQEPKN